MEIPKQLQKEGFRFVLLKRKEKLPFEKNWQTNGYSFNDEKLLKHLENNGNYGVIAGYGRLRILDIDNIEFVTSFSDKIKTFTVETGRGGRHFYFYSDYSKNHVLKKEMGELRCFNYQVVGAGSIHPNGKLYRVINDMDIQEINEETLMGVLKEFLREEIPNTEVNLDKEKDNSRSGKEFSKVISLIRLGKSKEEIFKEMMLFSKWSTAHPAYRELTYKKAKQFVDANPKSKQTGFGLAAIADKRLVVKNFLRAQPIFYDRARLWWIWDKSLFCWKLTDETDLLNELASLVKANTISSKERIELLEALKQEARLAMPIPAKKTWLQFKNAVVDIETLEKIEATPDFFVTNPIPWELGDSEDTPTMDKIFEEWVGKEYVQTLYEILAYCCLPSYPINRLFCLIGAGLNGKSKFLELISRFVGSRNISSTELDILLNNRFEITRLHKKLVCLMGETNFSELSQTSILKKLTGGDLIGFEYKNKDLFDDYSYAKIIIATNNLPVTTDKTIGFFRRWLIIDFPNRFSEKKDILADIPEEEYCNLARKTVSILRTLLETRSFTNEGSVEDRMQRYEEKSDPFEKFWKEKINEEDPNSYIFKFEFRKELDNFCQNNRFRILSERHISEKMRQHGITTGRVYANWTTTDGSNPRVWGWLGISWKDGTPSLLSSLSSLSTHSPLRNTYGKLSGDPLDKLDNLDNSVADSSEGQKVYIFDKKHMEMEEEIENDEK